MDRLPQVLSAQNSVAILEERVPLSPDLLLGHGMAEFVLLLLCQDLASLERCRIVNLTMLVRDHTIITSLHPTRNKCFMGIQVEASLIIFIFTVLIRERKEVHVLPSPITVYFGHPLESDELNNDSEGRRSRLFSVSTIRSLRLTCGCILSATTHWVSFY